MTTAKADEQGSNHDPEGRCGIGSGCVSGDEVVLHRRRRRLAYPRRKLAESPFEKYRGYLRAS